MLPCIGSERRAWAVSSMQTVGRQVQFYRQFQWNQLKLVARNFLFHPLRSLPAKGPGSEGVRGEVGGDRSGTLLIVCPLNCVP